MLTVSVVSNQVQLWVGIVRMAQVLDEGFFVSVTFHNFFSSWKFGVTVENISMCYGTLCSSLTRMGFDRFFVKLIKHNVHVMGFSNGARNAVTKFSSVVFHCHDVWQMTLIPINKFEIYQFQRHCWEYCQFSTSVCLFFFSYPHIHWRVLMGLVRVHVWKTEIDGYLYFEKLQANLHTASPHHRYLWFQLELLSWAIPLSLPPSLLAYERCQASQLWISVTFAHQWQEFYPHSLRVMQLPFMIFVRCPCWIRLGFYASSALLIFCFCPQHLIFSYCLILFCDASLFCHYLQAHHMHCSANETPSQYIYNMIATCYPCSHYCHVII